MIDFKQERPNWCPNKDCEFKIIAQELICGGKLSKPIDHNGDFNTHRVCFHFPTDSGIEKTVPIQMNHTDLWNLKRVIGVLDKYRPRAYHHKKRAKKKEKECPK